MQEEHFAIREKKRAEDPIDWDDLTAMKFTRAVLTVVFLTVL